MNSSLSNRCVNYMPVGARHCLASIALWRIKHANDLRSLLPLGFIVLSSIALGYGAAKFHAIGSNVSVVYTTHPAVAVAHEPLQAETSDITRQQSDPLATELGALQGHIIRLRVLFLRLAEMADIDDGEFDLDLDFIPDHIDPKFDPMGILGYSGQKSADPTPLVLVKRLLTHISDQSIRMKSIFEQRRQTYDRNISGFPVERAQVSSRFGYRIDPASGRSQMHRGLDLSASPGTEIRALADGVVTYAGKNGGYGNLVEIEHSDGYRTRYAHNDTVLVPLGQQVHKGQRISTMGSTGRSTGTHVHVEVLHEGRRIDPQLFIR